ncbi:hypothetical protein [Streptomyces sp. x-80]|uniref:hypothetical protein n=1 Tax=Streptomyces sp. x-80 TaxID=2789282 RepID=UPI0039817C16
MSRCRWPTGHGRADYGTNSTDDRRKAAHLADRDAPRATHPHLCDDCKRRAATATRQAEQDERAEWDEWVSAGAGFRISVPLPGRTGRHGRTGRRQ